MSEQNGNVVDVTSAQAHPYREVLEGLAFLVNAIKQGHVASLTLQWVRVDASSGHAGYVVQESPNVSAVIMLGELQLHTHAMANALQAHRNEQVKK